MVEKVMEVIPTVRYVGWDIVIKGNGQILLIEGNNNARHDIRQLTIQRGRWNDYKKVI